MSVVIAIVNDIDLVIDLVIVYCCYRCAWLADEDAPPKVQRFQTLISLMLSSQTRDEMNAAAVTALKKLPGMYNLLLTMKCFQMDDHFIVISIVSIVFFHLVIFFVQFLFIFPF